MRFDFEISRVDCRSLFLVAGIAQSVGLLTRKSELRYPVWPHTFVSPFADSRGAVVSYWGKYVHEVLVNRLGGLSLPKKSVVRLSDRSDMTLDVYRGCKTTTTTFIFVYRLIKTRQTLANSWRA